MTASSYTLETCDLDLKSGLNHNACLLRMNKQDKDKIGTTFFPSSLLRRHWLWKAVWEPPSFDLRGSFACVLAKYPLFVYTCLQVGGAAAKHKVKRWRECSQTRTHKVLNDASHMCDTLRVWRYDKVEWNLLITLLLARLFVLVSSTHTYLLPLPCSLIHLPTLPEECRVSAMMQRPTNERWWEQLGSVVGTLLPSLLSLPGNRCCLGEGPPAARRLNEHQTKTLTNRWVTRVSVGFSVVYYFSLPHHSFSFMAGTLLYILAGWKKK